jgi:hypothetical protein
MVTIIYVLTSYDAKKKLLSIIAKIVPYRLIKLIKLNNLTIYFLNETFQMVCQLKAVPSINPNC